MSRRGSGTWVARVEVAAPGPTLVERAIGQAVGHDRRAEAGPATVNLAAPVVPHLPPELELGVTTADLRAQLPGHGYDPMGMAALRALVAERHRSQGEAVTASQVLITNGAHHGLAVAIGGLLRAGEPVAVEDHTFGGILDLLDDRGSVSIPVRRDPDGIDPDQLRQVLQRRRPKAVILVAPVHSPTGTTWSSDRLDAVAAVLDEANGPPSGAAVTVIVDEALADLSHQAPEPGLVARCQRATVVRVGSLSKSVWGGLRVGWLTAPTPVFDTLARQRARRDLGTAMASQLMAARLIDQLDEVAGRRRPLLAGRSAQAAEALASAFPSWDITPPSGGAMVWCRLPLVDTTGFATYARQFGVATLPGSAVRVGRDADPHLRVATDVEPATLHDGLARLQRAWTTWTNA